MWDGIEYADPDNKNSCYTLVEGDMNAPLVLPNADTQLMHKDARSSGRWNEEVNKTAK